MKKSLLITLGLIVMLVPACGPQSATNNNNANQNPNRNAAQNANNANRSGGTLTYQNEAFTAIDIPSVITMRYDVSKTGSIIDIKETCLGCTTTIPFLKTISMDANAVLKWKVEFTGFTSVVKAYIKDFKNLSMVPTTSPDQPDLPTFPSANPFDSGSSTTSPTYNFVPGDMPISVKPYKAGTYKYSVVVEWTNSLGATQTYSMDPRVVFSDGTLFLNNTTVTSPK